MVSKISIVIPTLNEEKYLPKLLDSLVKQTFNGSAEIIIVDGKSIDKTIHIARTYAKKLPYLSIFQIEKNIGGQRNFGAEKARFDHILFLDADMILPPKFLSQLLQKVNPQERTVTITMCWGAEFDIVSTLVIILLIPLGICFCLLKHYAPGFLLLTTKENHKKLGGFRTDLTLAEDIDYAIRSDVSGATYHLFFFPIAFHSVRRIRKMGALPFIIFYLKGLYFLQRYGVDYFTRDFHYPFGQH